MAFMMARSRAEPWAFMTVAVEAQQRRAAVDLRVHAPLDGAKGVLGPAARRACRCGLAVNSRLSIANIAMARLSQVFSTMLPTKPSQTTTSTWLSKQVVAFDVADEIQVQLLAELEGLQRQFVALVSSVPTLRMPTRGFWQPRISRE